MKRILLLVSVLFLSASLVVANPTQQAKSVESLDAIKALPVLHDGRVKPLDTYARSLLLQLSGKEHVNGKSAIAWLAQVLFDPNQAQDDLVFLINHPDIAKALSIEKQKSRRYSFKSLVDVHEALANLAQAASEIEADDQSVVEQEILRVFANFQHYSLLTQVFQFAFAHPDFTISSAKLRDALEMSSDKPITLSFIDVAVRADLLSQLTEGLPDKPMDSWNKSEENMILILGNLFSWSMRYGEMPFDIIPSRENKEQWLSPWEAINLEFQNPAIHEEIVGFSKIANAYRQGGQIKFNIEANKLSRSILKRIDVKPSLLQLELKYNQWKLFFLSKIFYLLAILILFAMLIFNRSFKKLAWGFLLAAFSVHTVGIIMRIMIMQRPPVSTLYETFIFVAWIIVIIGFIIEYFNKRWLGIVVASVGGFALLQVAGKYAADGDTMGMLIAVLNSNFWLLTHVLTITAGYGACCVSGIVGHVYLLQVAVKKSQEILTQTYHVLIGTLGVGLALSFLGTNLGGIWADQSWGRFWGWDPKENGALMIVLWCAILLHAKIGKLIGPVGMAVGSVLGLIVVMWAWFGVNLLSIGLHSYGFTSGIAISLLIYVFVELAFIVGVLYYIQSRK